VLSRSPRLCFYAAQLANKIASAEYLMIIDFVKQQKNVRFSPPAAIARALFRSKSFRFLSSLPLPA